MTDTTTPRPGYTLLRKPAIRSLKFYPAVSGGKYHACIVGTDLAFCNEKTRLRRVRIVGWDFMLDEMDHRPLFGGVVVSVGDTEAHPLLCKRCLLLVCNRTPGVQS